MDRRARAAPHVYLVTPPNAETGPGEHIAKIVTNSCRQENVG
jgi:hypothetical protein